MAADIQVQINPWVAVVQYFKSRPTLANPDVFGNQIAGRHRYNNGWQPGSLGFTVRPESGQPDLYTNTQPSRYECRIYGADEIVISNAFMPLQQVLSQFQRAVVDDALVQKIVLDTTPSFLDDPTLNMPFYLFFIQASVMEQGV